MLLQLHAQGKEFQMWIWIALERWIEAHAKHLILNNQNEGKKFPQSHVS